MILKRTQPLAPFKISTGRLSPPVLRPASGKPTTAVLLQPGGPSLPLQLAGRRRVKARFLSRGGAPVPPFEQVLGCAEHQVIAEQMAAFR